MQGNVISMNQQKGLYAVQTDLGTTVFEILGGYDIEMDDLISGNQDTHAGEILTNVTQGEKMDVFIQGIHCTPSNAKKLPGL